MYFSDVVSAAGYTAGRIYSVNPTCKLPLESGSCKAKNTVWGYDPKNNVCVNFNYGGCGGNGNRFATRKDCYKDCVYGVTQVEDDQFFESLWRDRRIQQ